MVRRVQAVPKSGVPHMPVAIAKLLEELGDSWSRLEPLPSLDAETFERWSIEAGQVLEVVGSLGDTPGNVPEEVDREVLRLADRCRLLGDCSMSATLASGAARRYRDRGDVLDELNARRVEGISLQVAGEHESAREHLGETYRRLAERFPAEPLTGIVLADFAQCVQDDHDEARALLLESLERLEAESGSVFEQATGRSYEIELARRHTQLAECSLRRMWANGMDPAEAHKAEVEIRFHLGEASGRTISQAELAFVGVAEAELALLTGRRDRGLDILRTLEQQAHEDHRLGSILAPTYTLLAKFAAREGERGEAIEHCRRSLLASLHFGNRAHEPLAVETFIEVMRDTHEVNEDSPEVDNLARVLIEMLEAKDWYTGRNHSQSVGSLACRIGKVLQVQGIGNSNPDSVDWLDLRILRLAGQLHDVGKLAIPWALLNKINPLSDDEFLAVRNHVVKSEEFLLELGLDRVAHIAAQHHERPDGRGYPRGIQDVSLMGGIVAVADAFEAMITANRRYRARMTRDEAVEEILRCKETMFDPRAADAVAGLFRRSQVVEAG